jgi:hypothetical protein
VVAIESIECEGVDVDVVWKESSEKMSKANIEFTGFAFLLLMSDLT